MSGNIPGKDMNGVEKGMEFSREAWEKELSKFYVCRSDMNKLIMNYLITEGFREAAEKFQVEGGIKAPVLSGSMDDRIRVRDSIQNGYLQEARELLNQLHPELLDDNRLLRFHLLQQELIELIRKGSVEDALAFAQKHLAETGEEDPSVLPELERTLALLAFDQPGTSPFADLLHPAHRQKVCGVLFYSDTML
ncbi:unnamed protein product [Darwinula stevensoni]|uniref:CTLH domain-containing protein n=1 Tax=Darwinula stevensoni TaxID=69355 RepID=A0A7R9A076_9CRUS|nr:unnamed protein product [Darwinula stevensoni]CAG0880443.1 unnamed protein product [Darwinula stevensoni]